jgi:hypothetical protein
MIVDRRFRGAYCLHLQGWVPVVISRQHWYHPGLLTRPFQGLSCIHFTPSSDILLSLSLLLPPPAHCHWPVPSLSSLTTTGHLGNRHLYKPRSFRRSAWLSRERITSEASEFRFRDHIGLLLFTALWLGLLLCSDHRDVCGRTGLF